MGTKSSIGIASRLYKPAVPALERLTHSLPPSFKEGPENGLKLRNLKRK